MALSLKQMRQRVQDVVYVSKHLGASAGAKYVDGNVVDVKISDLDPQISYYVARAIESDDIPNYEEGSQ